METKCVRASWIMNSLIYQRLDNDDGMDLVVSWGLTDSEITLAILWTKVEDFCKPQSNEVRARFDLLTSFRQRD